MNDLDDIETMLVFLLESQLPTFEDDRRNAQPINPHQMSTGGAWNVSDGSRQLHLPNREPEISYTMNPLDLDRLYTTSPEYLIAHPKEIVGSGIETIILGDNKMKWSGFYPLKKRPKKAACLGKADCWFEVHYKEGNTSKGWELYHKGVVALSSAGRSLPIKITETIEPPCAENGKSLIISCSVVEDAHSANHVCATVTADKKLIFPVGNSIYKDFFRLRDAPTATPTGRRNPIIHMVAEHMRKQRDGKESAVRSHVRGVEEIVISGMSLSLSANWINELRSLA